MKGTATKLATLVTIAALTFLAFTLTACDSLGADDRTIFERGVWAIEEADGCYMGKSAGSSYDWSFTYNEKGQATESKVFYSFYNNVSGDSNNYTWSDDGLSFHNSYAHFSGSFGEISTDGETDGTYQVEYGDLTASCKLPDGTVDLTVEYREDGTLSRKVVSGSSSDDYLRTYEYNEHGDLVRYVRTNKEDTLYVEKLFDIRYEDDMPVGATVSMNSRIDYSDGTTHKDEETYEITLEVDENGNVISAKEVGDKWRTRTFSWVYIEHPDPLARLLIENQMSSALEVM